MSKARTHRRWVRALPRSVFLQLLHNFVGILSGRLTSAP